MKKIIVILETSDVAARYTGLAVQKLGFRPLFLLSGLHQYQGDTRSQLQEFDFIECGNSTDTTVVLKALAQFQAGQIEAVVTLLDSRLFTAQQVAHALGIKGLDPALASITEKSAVTKLIPEFSPCSAIIKAGEKVTPLLATMPGVRHLIAKPSRGAGALGYGEFDLEVDSVASIDEHIARQCTKLGVDTFILQQRLMGRLTSLEGYVIDGACHFLGFSLRKKIAQTESANLFPADQSLTPAAQQMAKDAIVALVTRSGVRQSYFHSEFIVDDHSAMLIDANFGRIAGAAISEQIATALGLDPIDLIAHVLNVGYLNTSTPLEFLSLQETMSVFYGLKSKGKLTGVELPKDFNLRHIQILDDQTEIPAMGGDNWAWLGLASGTSAQVKTQIEQIRITTTDGVFAPYFLETGHSLSAW